MVSPGNHKANGLAEKYVGRLHDAMALLPSKDLTAWPKLCGQIAHALRVQPCVDTLVSPLEMLTGRQPKHPYTQPTVVPLIRVDLVDSETRRRSYIRACAMIKREQEESEKPLRPYVRNVQSFQPGELLRMKADNAQASVLQGRPRKGIQQWSGKGRIIEAVEGHPDQYLVENLATGRIVRRSAATIVRAFDKKKKEDRPQSC